MAERTEAPSKKRLADARKEGQIPRSRLLASTAAMLGGLAALVGTLSHSAQAMAAWAAPLLSGEQPSALRALTEGIGVLARAVGPVFAGALGGALAAGVATAGFGFNPGIVAPKLERVSMAKGFGRIFRVASVVEVFKAAGVLCALAAFLSTQSGLVRPVLQTVRSVGLVGWFASLQLLQGTLLKGAWILLGLGLLDFGVARWLHVRKLRMSREELKREHKDADGDPQARGRRKSLHRALVMSGPQRGVQRATALVVNPTHIAVALRYHEDECDAPYLVAKGREQDALELRHQAKRLGIPIVRDVPLARSLIQYDVGEEIPEELYVAAAVILKIASRAAQSPEDPPGDV